ncbi:MULTISPECIES: RNA chaperone Hfq [Tissierellales]|uniref:RNA chaperone Hfq n=1 Tax=Tissierellales TaxID=1737405 RepID=UPI0008A00F8F|nr:MULTISPECIES: RNA chaperone Hfq [Tissierellales]SCL82676.1 Host factor-I protein [Sporanaerobacter sp. PP17-6a]
MKTAINLQDVFLNRVRKENVSITVFLINGYQLRGYVKGFDNYIIILDTDGKQQLIYKHAISTIVPTKVLNVSGKILEEED